MKRARRKADSNVRATRLRGASGFEAHYAATWGERWGTLREALLTRGALPGEGRVIRENRFADPNAREDAYDGLDEVLEGCRRFARGSAIDRRDAQGLSLGYVMDPASVLAARQLPLEGATEILDLCAAPGGKSLILAEQMDPEAHLTLNDRSPARRTRLHKVLRDFLPPAVLARVRVTGLDGRRMGQRRDSYDAILLDAPCSSEGHVLLDESALADWSSSRIERLARDQYGLLTAAMLALRPGGVLVYSTCALCREENDGVIERLLERRRHAASVEPVLGAPFGERTKHGWQILPDDSGYGPLYFARLRKPQSA